MTERDHNEQRWEAALELGSAANTAIVDVRKMVQRGFETLGREQLEQAHEIAAIQQSLTSIGPRLIRLEATARYHGRLLLLLTALLCVVLTAAIAQAALWWYTAARLL